MGKKKQTLKRWITKVLCLELMIMAVVVLLVPWYMGYKMRLQVTEANEKTSEVYMEFLDNNVGSLNTLLLRSGSNNTNMRQLVKSSDEIESFMLKQELLRQLKDYSLVYNVVDGIFIYSEAAMEDTFLCQIGQKGSGRQQEDIKEMIRRGEIDFSPNTWDLVSYNQTNYLIRVICGADACCGAWIDVSSLGLPLNIGEKNMTLFLDQNGQILSTIPEELEGVSTLPQTSSGKLSRLNHEKYLTIIKASGLLPISMAILLSEQEYMGSIYTFQNIVGLIMALLLLSFPLLWRRLSKYVTAPVNELIHSMNEVQKGNLNVRVEDQSRFVEFSETSAYFNSMVQEIQTLQRDVYERQIREQKIELQYLQTQIRPHFFLNTLNVIYSFSLVKRNDLIEKMVVCLSKYFSYMFRATDDLSSLKAEKEHIENYLKLQRLRYQNQFICHLEIEEVLLDAKLPPLVIQTFVENSLKYGLLPDKTLELELLAETVMVESEQKLKITVSDNGPGYDEAIVAAVENGADIKEAHGHGIGINNVRARLKLIYKDEAWVRLFNMPGLGACTEIVLPLEFVEEEE